MEGEGEDVSQGFLIFESNDCPENQMKTRSLSMENAHMDGHSFAHDFRRFMTLAPKVLFKQFLSLVAVLLTWVCPCRLPTGGWGWDNCKVQDLSADAVAATP